MEPENITSIKIIIEAKEHKDDHTSIEETYFGEACQKLVNDNPLFYKIINE